MAVVKSGHASDWLRFSGRYYSKTATCTKKVSCH